MVFSRRPARFKRAPTKYITREQLKMLREAAARVFIHEKSPAKKSSEVNTIAGGSADVKMEKPIFYNENDGVQWLADTAAKLEAEEGNLNN